MIWNYMKKTMKLYEKCIKNNEIIWNWYEIIWKLYEKI